MAYLLCRGSGCFGVRVSLSGLAPSFPTSSAADILELQLGQEVGLQGQSSWAQLFDHIKPEIKDQ